MSVESRFFDYDVEPDAARVIAPPPSTPEDAAHLVRVRRWTLFVITAGFALLGALLGISDPRFTP